MSKFKSDYESLENEILKCKCDYEFILRELETLQKNQANFLKFFRETFEENKIIHPIKSEMIKLKSNLIDLIKEKDKLKDQLKKLNRCNGNIMRKDENECKSEPVEKTRVKITLKPWIDEVDKIIEEVYKRWVDFGQTITLE
ncbi:hypothetical protein AVEN_149171-1 [Araneus ventricosus]|uniref:Uncharacterized protein n=1 Tax=Araneus ventricosus TaxID=182803 RepID=A0A4Y2TD74_ARAVE|nr:hypothetical protein AVEN_149171-1 [Araneus ventricosus]